MKKYILAITLLIATTSVAHSQSEPPYGMSELQAYSIFYENFRTGDWEMARMYGRWMLEKKPETIQGYNRFELPRQFDRMVTVYAELSKQQTDPSMRAAYIDTALTIFEDAFATFDEGKIDYYTWHFNRGRFYQENMSQIRNGMDLAYEEYEKAFELDPERLTQAGNGYYIQILLSHYASQNNREAALEMIDIAEQYASADLAAAIDEVRDGLFTNPEERIEFLEGRLENNPGDLGLISELASMYERAGNREKAIEFARKLYDIEASFENIRRLADYAKADGQNRVAIRFLNEAVEVTDDRDVRKNLVLEISELHQNEGNLQEARRFARQASQIDPNWGQPYIRMARIYASAISQCSAGRQIDRDDRTVYWLVLDYLDRARSADPSVANAVTREYRTYTPALPTAEDKFFRGWETGETVQIGSNISECYAWINETTTVR
jgi:tetratricopeptide (TPR) repeat protein